MSVMDAPDWEKIVTLKSGGSLSDAPDWEYLVTGPGAVSPVVGAGASPYSVYESMGFVGLTMDPAFQSTNLALTSGKVNLIAFAAGSTVTINKVYVVVTTGHTPTANENFLCLYDWGQTTAGTFTLLGQTAAGAIDTALHTGNLVTGTLTVGVAVTAGSVYALALIMNGATTPDVIGATSISAIVVNPFGTTSPVIVVSTASTFTSPPGSLAFSACTTSPSPFFMACSN